MPYLLTELVNVLLSLMRVADDFKPASIDPTQHSVIDIEQGNKVKVTVPHVEVACLSDTFITLHLGIQLTRVVSGL